MKHCDYLLFDLDGTLTESGEGIVNSVLYALQKRGIKETDRGKLYAFVGPPLLVSLEKLYGITGEDAISFIDDYREYYNERGWKENAVYPDIPASLERLYNEGRKLVVATSKPEAASKRILAYFQLNSWFVMVAGASMDESRSKKEDVIAYALKRLGITGKECLMVGDRAEDIVGANANGIPGIGVLYGYGTRQELIEAHAAALCGEAKDLPGVIATLESKTSG